MRYLGPILLTRLNLLIVDEAHQVVPEDNDNTKNSFADHSNRSLRLESFVSRLLTLSPDIVRIALTAVAGGASLPVARWIEKREDAEAIGTRYRSTRQIIGVLQTSPRSSGRMLLELMNGRPLYVHGRDEPVYINLRIPSMPQLPASMRNSIYRFNQLNVLWAALHLIDDERRILISIAQQPEKTMRWYKEALEMGEWQDSISFTPPEGGDQLYWFRETRAACVDYCGEDSYEVALLDRGIATNYGQMPQRLRRLMTDLIDRCICPITVATATLTEGVNLPFDLIFVTALKRTTFDPSIQQQVDIPLSTSEFNNLAGRAGRPGATKGMEGMTLVAIPQQPSTTAPGQIRTQRRQIVNIKNDYENLRHNLLAEEMEGDDINGPLALLLSSIAERATDLYGIEDDQFIEWLESVIPVEISEDAGKGESSMEAQLADSVDELDGVLLSALEEFNRIDNQALEGAAVEIFLASLWQKTFTRVAAIQEAWMEQAFIRRGHRIIDVIYPDADERKRLYQYGFTPFVGRRFEQIAPEIRAIIEASNKYGSASINERLKIFENLGSLLEDERGFGFRVRNTNTDRLLLEKWKDVFGWWMKVEDADRPDPDKLRSWQRFVTDNIEFRLGVAVGSVVAQAWADGTEDPLEVPSLDAWRETTGLPWFGFWARELLRWGTLDPFVAFALAQGLARTRSEASDRRQEFEIWLSDNHENIEDDDKIDPQLFLQWGRSLPQEVTEVQDGIYIDAELTGTSGQHTSYNVIPIIDSDYVSWIDASGYELARSQFQEGLMGANTFKNDFELQISSDSVVVQKIYSA